MAQYKLWKPGNSLRWKGGQSIKLEGSDHAPVYTSLLEIPSVFQHSTPSLSARYIPMVRGLQQTLVSVLMKRQVPEQVNSDGDITKESCSERESSSNQCSTPGVPSSNSCSSRQNFEVLSSKANVHSSVFSIEATCNTLATLGGQRTKTTCGSEPKKKAKRSSQLSLKSFFQESSIPGNCVSNGTGTSTNQIDVADSNHLSNETPILENQSGSPKQCELNSSVSIEEQDEVDVCSLKKEKNNFALMEWQRLQQVMQNSIPLCKGHRQPCVVRSPYRGLHLTLKQIVII